jgi:hypothetical protein
MTGKTTYVAKRTHPGWSEGVRGVPVVLCGIPIEWLSKTSVPVPPYPHNPQLVGNRRIDQPSKERAPWYVHLTSVLKGGSLGAADAPADESPDGSSGQSYLLDPHLSSFPPHNPQSAGQIGAAPGCCKSVSVNKQCRMLPGPFAALRFENATGEGHA